MGTHTLRLLCVDMSKLQETLLLYLLNLSTETIVCVRRFVLQIHVEQEQKRAYTLIFKGFS
jgi:hypothetical protein